MYVPAVPRIASFYNKGLWVKKFIEFIEILAVKKQILMPLFREIWFAYSDLHFVPRTPYSRYKMAVK